MEGTQSGTGAGARLTGREEALPQCSDPRDGDVEGRRLVVRGTQDTLRLGAAWRAADAAHRPRGDGARLRARIHSDSLTPCQAWQSLRAQLRGRCGLTDQGAQSTFR